MKYRHPGAVVASDVRSSRELLQGGSFVYLDVQDKDNLTRIVLENGITHVVRVLSSVPTVLLASPMLQHMLKHELPCRCTSPRSFQVTVILGSSIGTLLLKGMTLKYYFARLRSFCYTCSHWRAQPAAGSESEYTRSSGNM